MGGTAWRTLDSRGEVVRNGCNGVAHALGGRVVMPWHGGWRWGASCLYITQPRTRDLLPGPAHFRHTYIRLAYTCEHTNTGRIDWLSGGTSPAKQPGGPKKGCQFMAYAYERIYTRKFPPGHSRRRWRPSPRRCPGRSRSGSSARPICATACYAGCGFVGWCVCDGVIIVCHRAWMWDRV